MMTEIKTVTDPTLDANSRFTQTFSKFVAVKNAVVSGSDGYVPHIQAISGNIVTVEVRRYGGASHTGSAVAAHAALAAHNHDVLITGGQGTGEALQQLASVIGKTAAGNVTDTTSVQAISGGTPDAHVVTQPSAHAAAVLAAVGAGAITATFRVMAEGI